MKRYITLVALVTALFLSAVSCEREGAADPAGYDDASATHDPSGRIPGHYIVILKAEAGKAIGLKNSTGYARRTALAKNTIKTMLAAYAIPEDRMERTYSTAVFGFSGRFDADQLNRLRTDPDVAYIEADRLTLAPLPAPEPYDGGNDNGTQTIPPGISRVGYGDGTGKTAWILDSGIDMGHPDLNVDAGRSVSFTLENDQVVPPDDDNGHGTHVAGTIAAINNDTGVVGVAAGATVVAVKVLNYEGYGPYSAIIKGVDYVAANAAPGDVVNMSLIGPPSTSLDNAVVSAAAKGIIFCLAAGNDAANADNYSPARVNAPNVYTISAMDHSDEWASFSNYGTAIDYCAPGVSVLSTWPGGGYRSLNGTSMACPHAAGVFLISETIPKNDETVIGDPDTRPDPIITL